MATVLRQDGFVVRVYGMRDRDVVRAFRIVEQHLERIRLAWREMHG